MPNYEREGLPAPIYYATSSPDPWTPMTTAEMAAGLKCGRLDLGQVNFLFNKAFTSISDLIDFLKSPAVPYLDEVLAQNDGVVNAEPVYAVIDRTTWAGFDVPKIWDADRSAYVVATYNTSGMTVAADFDTTVFRGAMVWLGDVNYVWRRSLNGGAGAYVDWVLHSADYPTGLTDENSPASGAFVNAAIAAISPCSAIAATVDEIAAMTADPSTMRLAVCNNDGTPSVVGIDGDDLADILGLGTGGAVSGTFVTTGSGNANFRLYRHDSGDSNLGDTSSITIPAGFWKLTGSASSSNASPITLSGTATANMYCINEEQIVSNPATTPFTHDLNGLQGAAFDGYVTGGDVLTISASGGETYFTVHLTRLNP